MTALSRWNVRIIDYLMERGVDPTIEDSYGFTAKRKAQLKNLRTIHSMLDQYESNYNQKKPANLPMPITNEKWQPAFAEFYSGNTR